MFKLKNITTIFIYQFTNNIQINATKNADKVCFTAWFSD